MERDEWKTWPLSDYDAWLADLKHWRQEYLVRIGYDGSEYDRPELRWIQRNFILQHVMVEDRYFYDPAARKYTVDCYLDDLDKRYGGTDSVLIWPVYPNIGIDNRNQWDLHRDLPGGILRGGSYYRPQGSICYFPEACRLDEQGKLLTMAPIMDQAGTLGFRCVMDAQ